MCNLLYLYIETSSESLIGNPVPVLKHWKQWQSDRLEWNSERKGTNSEEDGN